MAFKKAKGKGKVVKKKGKKSGGKRDEWSHEGGVQVLDGRDAENQDGAEKRKRRLTQDREESIRRGKLKNNDRKRQKDFRVKMSKKVKFGDILEKPDEVVTDGESETEKAHKIELRPNPLGVMDRLKKFVGKSLKMRESSGSDMDHDDEHIVEGSADDEAEESDGEHSDGDEESETGEEIDAEEEEVDEGEVDDMDVQDGDQAADEEQDDDSGDEQAESTKADFFYDRQFNKPSDVELGAEKPKMRKLANVGTTSDEIYGTLGFADDEGESETGLPCNLGPFKSVSQVPGLHKLFRGSAASRRIDESVINEQNATLLPFVSAYTDAFIEGRERSNDAKLLQCMLFHAVSHTVKARLVLII